MGLVILASIGMIVLGLLGLFGRDTLWSLTRFQNRLEGRASERTELWNQS